VEVDPTVIQSQRLAVQRLLASCGAVVLLASLPFVAAQTTPPEGVAFGRAPLPKGIHLVATSSNEQSVKSTVKGGGVEQAVDGTTRVDFGWDVAVTASDEKGAQAGTIDVTRAHIHVAMPLGEQDEESSAAGRSWQAKRADAGWSFTTKEGPAPDEETNTTLRAIAARALEAAPFAATLDGKRLAVGETLKLAPDDAKRLLATFAESWTVDAFELKLKSVKRDGKADAKDGSESETAQFDVTAALSASGENSVGADASMALSGELVFSTAHSLLLRASLSGPIKIDGKVGDGEGAVTIQGSGEAKWSFAAELK
jgi:hypothetical protein